MTKAERKYIKLKEEYKSSTPLSIQKDIERTNDYIVQYTKLNMPLEIEHFQIHLKMLLEAQKEQKEEMVEHQVELAEHLGKEPVITVSLTLEEIKQLKSLISTTIEYDADGWLCGDGVTIDKVRENILKQINTKLTQ